MKTFKDADGMEWVIDINVDARNQVAAKVPGVDFYDVGVVVNKLADKPTLGAVLFALCQEQIEKRQLTDRDFFRRIKGDVWDGVMEALHLELADFFQKGERQMILAARRKTMEHQEKALARAMAKLEAMDLDAEMDKAEAARTSSGPSTGLPGGSELIPGP